MTQSAPGSGAARIVAMSKGWVRIYRELWCQTCAWQFGIQASYGVAAGGAATRAWGTTGEFSRIGDFRVMPTNVPKSIAEIDFADLTRRQYTPSPDCWADQILYFLMLD